VEAVSVIQNAANVIPRLQLGTYIFVSFSVGEVGKTWRIAIRECEMLIERLNKENHSGHS
jgi:hypothetical protein